MGTGQRTHRIHTCSPLCISSVRNIDLFFVWTFASYSTACFLSLALSLLFVSFILFYGRRVSKKTERLETHGRVIVAEIMNIRYIGEDFTTVFELDLRWQHPATHSFYWFRTIMGLEGYDHHGYPRQSGSPDLEGAHMQVLIDPDDPSLYQILDTPPF